jgi:uncharacterized membrane protein required for colicin V production
MRWIDLLGTTLVVLFLVLGARRGLWWQLVRLLGIVASVSVARALAPRVAPALESALPGLSPSIASGLAWLGILIAMMVVLSLIGRLGKATLEAAQLGAVDRVGGALAGSASGLLVHVAILLCMCQLAPIAWAKDTIHGTHSQALLEGLGDRFPRLLDAHAADSLREIRKDSAPVR